MANAKKSKPAGPANRGLQITARPASFWRCGRQFTAEPTTIPFSELSEEEVETLKGEALLAVAEVDIAEPT